MSSRRSRSRQSGSSRISEDQLLDLVTKLQQLLPELRNSRRADKVYIFCYIHNIITLLTYLNSPTN
ncbi:unnamed protein product [Linum tenue]|uniref:Uncharacterized protein n=1 Tax=Linum tenue TaxID=586396 RepID=A0AAV0IP61_9ROSI|nr:unnamed protein product [Linum tenue]